MKPTTAARPTRPDASIPSGVFPTGRRSVLRMPGRLALLLALPVTFALAAISAATSTSTVTAAAAATTEADRLVREGQELYRQRNLGEALLRFEQAVKAGAEGGELFYQMGLCYKAVRSDAASGKEYMLKAAPLLEKSLDTARSPASFYYLSAIYMNELADSAKGTAVAQRGITMADQGTFGKELDGEATFQVGRLHSLSAQPDKAAALYEKAYAALEREKTPNVQYRISAAEQLSSYHLNKQDFDKAGTWMIRLVTLDPSRQKERLTAGLTLLKAGRHQEAVDVLNGFTDDELATEGNYLQRITRRFLELGKPALPPGAAGLDAKGLNEALMKSAAALGEIRKKEEESEKVEPPAELPYTWVTTPKGAKAKSYPRRVYPPADWQPKDPKNPTPDEVAYMAGEAVVKHKPAKPLSAERINGEKEFFSLLLETVRRGQSLREMAITQGITSLIFR